MVVRGTLSITASELYFEVDDDEPSFKAIDPKVRDSNFIDQVSHWGLLRGGSNFPRAGERNAEAFNFTAKSKTKCFLDLFFLN